MSSASVDFAAANMRCACARASASASSRFSFSARIDRPNMSYVDLTARTIQGEDRSKKYPWFRAKNLDGFCPLGPCFVPRDFLDLSDLRVTCEVGGELRQDASTRDWIVDLPAAIVALSRHLTLHPGDLILMGMPAGVGPLVDGDRVRCKVEGIGILDTHISRPSP